MRLNSIVINNFKGIKELSVKQIGNELTLSGRNGSGKTTVLSAITWALFDKNLDGQTVNPLPLDSSGEVISGDVSVELEFMLDNKVIALRRLYKETFTKKRGSVTAAKTGNTSEFYIGEEPVKAGDFKRFIEEIVSEELFYVLSIPGYFGGKLHWETRRRYLMSLAINPTIEDVALYEPNIRDVNVYEQLKEVEPGEHFRALDKHKILLQSKMKTINNQLEGLPARIDELSKQKKEVIDADTSQLEELQLELERLLRLSKVDADVETKDKITKLTKDLSERRNSLSLARKSKQAIQDSVVLNKKNETDFIAKELNLIVSKINNTELIAKKRDNEVDRLDHKIELKRNEIDKARQDYVKLAETIANYQPNEFCPTCNQKLPDSEVEAAKERFLSVELENLEKIKQNGIELKQRLAEITDNKLRLLAIELEPALGLINEREALEVKLKEVEARDVPESLQEQLDNVEAQIKDKTDEIYNLELEIKELQASLKAPDTSHSLEIENTRAQIKQLEQSQFEIKRNLEIDERIIELKQQIKQLQADHEGLEEQLYLTELIVKTRVKIIEKDLSDKFETVSFKLFEQQINGGIREVCDVVYGGATDLSTGERMATDVEISERFCKHHNTYPLLLVDNVNNLTLKLNTTRQIIKAVVEDDSFKITNL